MGKRNKKERKNAFDPERIWRCTRAGVLLRMQDLHCTTNAICITARLAGLCWKAPRNKRHLYSASSCDIWRSKALIKSGYLKIKIGYLTPAFLGARKWAEMLPNPCILGVPSKGDKIFGRLWRNPVYGL